MSGLHANSINGQTSKDAWRSFLKTLHGQDRNGKQTIGQIMERLVCAIILQAIKDLDQPKKRTEVQKFIDSKWFDTLAEIANLDPNSARTKLATGAYIPISLRAAYRRSYNRIGKEAIVSQV